jgi:hypothetical protein
MLVRIRKCRAMTQECCLKPAGAWPRRFRGFVPIESRNHLILEDEPAFGHFLDQLKSFLKSS